MDFAGRFLNAAKQPLCNDALGALDLPNQELDAIVDNRHAHE